MRNILFAALLVFMGIAANAQPWMHTTGTGPVKYADALYNYEHSRYYIADKDVDKDADEHEAENEKGEVKNHLFKKWDWYWKQHLDQDGYMVPPVRTLEAWQAYITAHSIASARTTNLASNWVFQGPDSCNHGYSGMGRINIVAFDPVDSNTFYIGSAAGSTWKTTDGGLTWTSLYTNLPTLGVADIKINPINPNTIYVATGDGDAGDAYSSGVIISHDKGATWSTSGLTWLPTAYISGHSLLINPLDTSSMILGTNNGIYKTYNSGASWTNVFTGNFKQILYNPADTSMIYASMYTDTSAQIMRSLDGGITWNAMTSFTDVQRVALAVCPASPNVVKAVCSDNSSGLEGIYSSSDSGASFTGIFMENDTCGNNLLGYDLGLPTHNCGGQGWYDLCIAMDPRDPSAVVVGGVNTYYSSDSGHSWQLANQWWNGVSGMQTVHADKHCLAYNPIGKGLYETCDGGIYKNYGPVTNPWTDLTDGITITEFYNNAVDNQVPFCIGGSQDNGTKMIDSTATVDLTGGDGMQPLINYGDPFNIWYTSYPNGSIDMTRDGGANYHNITDTIHGSGAWVTPYVIDPQDTATLVLAYDRVYATNDNGVDWYPISPVFDSNADITTLAIAPSNPNYLYVTYFDYNVWQPFIKYTTNFGATWDTAITPTTTYISDIKVDPVNAQHIYMTISGYGVPKVWDYYTDTRRWRNITGSLPDIPVACVLVDTNFKTLYIGTDAAVYYRDTTMTDWALFDNNMPTVKVSDLQINYTTNEIWAATFGRGMWKSVKAQKPRAVGVPALVENNKSYIITPNPNKGNFTISATGTAAVGNEANVRLLSIDGKQVWSQQLTFDQSGMLKIDGVNVAPGFYICEITCKGDIVRRKLVIE